MIRIASIAVLVAVGMPAATAADAITLEPRYNPSLYAKLERSIDPDGSIYGLRFGASEKQLLEVLGVLRSGKLRELRVGEHVISWEVAQQMDGNPFFDRGDWELKPGVRRGMGFEEVQKLINRPAASPDHKFSYDTREASVALRFAGYSESGRHTGYKLMGFSILSYGQ